MRPKFYVFSQYVSTLKCSYNINFSCRNIYVAHITSIVTLSDTIRSVVDCLGIAHIFNVNCLNIWLKIILLRVLAGEYQAFKA